MEEFKYKGRNITQYREDNGDYYYVCSGIRYNTIHDLDLDICPETKEKAIRLSKKRKPKRRKKNVIR